MREHVEVYAVARQVRASDPHAVLRQRARLVRADHGGGAEGFHGGQLPDDRVAAGHPLDPDREDDRDGGGQALGDHGDGLAEREQHEVRQRQAAKEADDDNRRHGEDRERADELAERAHLLHERRQIRLDGLERRGDLAHLRVCTRRGDRERPVAADNEGAHVHDAVAVPHRGVPPRDQVGRLRDGEGLAGQEGLLDLETVGLNDVAVRGDRVPRLEEHDVSRDEFRGDDLAWDTAAHRHGLRRVQALERFEGPLRLELLHEADDDVDRDGDGDHERGQVMVDRDGDPDRAEQDEDERARELVGEERKRTAALPLGQLVRSEDGEAEGRLLLGKAVPIRVELMERVRHGKRVPRDIGQGIGCAAIRCRVSRRKKPPGTRTRALAHPIPLAARMSTCR